MGEDSAGNGKKTVGRFDGIPIWCRVRLVGWPETGLAMWRELLALYYGKWLANSESANPSVYSSRFDVWDSRARADVMNWSLFPYDYLSVTGGHAARLANDVSNKPFEQLSLEWAANPPSVTPRQFGCAVAMAWLAKKAYEKISADPNRCGAGRSFADFGWSADAYGVLARAVSETDAFDAALTDEAVGAAAAARIWYVRPHAVTGMFYVLGGPRPPKWADRLPRPLLTLVYRTWERFHPPYGADDMEDEVVEFLRSAVLSRRARP